MHPFFENLDGTEEPLLRHVSGTIRFDLRQGDAVEPWTVEVADGRVSVSHRRTKADCTATADAEIFDAVSRGEMNAVSATLRGDIEVEGQVALLLAFQRLFPGPASPERTRAETTGSGR